MIPFLLGSAVLLALCSLIIVYPWARRTAAGGRDEGAGNLEWYRLRRRELEAEGVAATVLQQDIELRLLEDEAQHTAPAAPATDGGFRVWLLLPPILLGAVFLYYRMGAMPDVLIADKLDGLSQQTSQQELQALMGELEQRIERRPGNLQYQALLGRFYMGQERYDDASRIYAGLATAAPEDPQILAYAAQARFLAEQRSLGDEAQMLAEQALSLDPHQRTALGLLGMASYEQGRYRAAIDYWQRLVALEQPGSPTATMIAGVIEQARLKLGEGGQAGVSAGRSDVQQATAAGAGITVRVELPPGAAVGPRDTVFVLARNAESDSRMPVAVRRLTGSDLPLTLRLDDSNSMAGQKLSSLAMAEVMVQVSPGGQPGAANASWLGQAGPLSPSGSTEPVTIRLQPAPN